MHHFWTQTLYFVKQAEPIGRIISGPKPFIL